MIGDLQLGFTSYKWASYNINLVLTCFDNSNAVGCGLPMLIMRAWASLTLSAYKMMLSRI